MRNTKSVQFVAGQQLRKMSDIATQFKNASAAVNSDDTPKKDVSPQIKLKMYALFKQVEVGPCTTSKPGFFDPVGRAKHDSWSELGNMSKEEAMKKYVAVVTDVFDGKIPDVVAAPVAPVVSSDSAAVQKKPVTLSSIAFPKMQGGSPLAALDLKCSIAEPCVNGVQKVVLNRPKRGNAFDIKLWEEFRQIFEALEGEAEAKCVILSGAGANFCTGMDLSVFTEMHSVGLKETCEGRRREGTMKFIQYLQDITGSPERCAVPVIAAVTGHCIGGGVDIITACDMRYCTKDANFCIKEIDLAIVSFGFKFT